MKLLFDQNLSPRLVELLADIYPGSTHVEQIGLDRVSDEEVWLYAKQGGFIICTKDVDFHERGILTGYPPKVIWISSGNCPTKRIEEILRMCFADIEKLLSDENIAFLMLS